MFIFTAACTAPESEGPAADATVEPAPEAAAAVRTTPPPVTPEDVRAVYMAATFQLAKLRRLREQLAAGEFPDVERTLDGYRQQWERDPRRELDLWNAFQRLSADPDLLPRLDEWVSASPDSYSAHLVRGLYYVSSGGALRGERFASETTAGQFDRMRQILALARRDLEAALERDPRAIFATTGLIRIAKLSGDEALLERALEIALSIDPANYASRRAYVIASQPRWGGSYAHMDRVNDEARPYATKNPLLIMLAGAKHHDVAQDLHERRRYNEAIEAFTRALESGPYPPSLRRRGQTWLALDHENRALADVNEAIVLDVLDPEAYKQRAKLHVHLGEFELALTDAEVAVFLDGFDAFAIQDRGWVHEKRGDTAAARRDYLNALDRDPANQWIKDRLAALPPS